MKTAENRIRDVLQHLQEGYNRRDPNYIDTFMKVYSLRDSSLIIGTDQGEVFRGFERAKELFLNDWKYWGQVKYDIDTSDIEVKGDMAWVFMFAELKMRFRADYLNKCALEDVKTTLANDTSSDNAKMVDILRISALSLVERLKGEVFNCPLRVTVILTKEEEEWFIKHLHFSNPIALFTSFPREEEG